MAVYTANPRYAATLLPEEVAQAFLPSEAGDAGLAPLLESVFNRPESLLTAPSHTIPWDHLLMVEFSPRSQYDLLIELAREKVGLPDRIACMAGSGLGFHGYKGRGWAAIPGNIHLAVHLAPNREVDRFEVAFTLLAALSVVEAVDGVQGLSGRAGIKWVNDILVEGSKVAGILAYTQTQERRVTSAVLGIGLNAEATPQVEPTPFVPRVASLREFVPPQEPDLRPQLFLDLLKSLDRNYRVLLEEGLSPLLARYRERSLVLGEEVTVCTEASHQSLRTVTEGRVLEIGEHLELILEGRPEPVRNGRIVLGRAEKEVTQWASANEDGALAYSVPGRASSDEGVGLPDR